ncbi:uncharacterized protein [Elaeis guineensis]|uniref:uncharacterized protein n=1 Tax=Elaeis guineensis var. tenera TaxID=51953 RepID=UPI003C6D4F11
MAEDAGGAAGRGTARGARPRRRCEAQAGARSSPRTRARGTARAQVLSAGTAQARMHGLAQAQAPLGLACTLVHRGLDSPWQTAFFGRFSWSMAPFHGSKYDRMAWVDPDLDPTCCGIFEIVRRAWRGHSNLNPATRISILLKATKRALLNWNKNTVGNLFRKARSLELEIAALQEADNNLGGLPSAKHNTLLRKLSEHNRLLRQQEIFWRQKSRIRWLKEGDMNSNSILRRRRNRIWRVKSMNGSDVTEETDIRDSFKEYFESKWNPLAVDCPASLPNYLPHLSEDDNMLLTSQEILHSLMEISPERKALMLAKVDMERAYDNVRWDYLLSVLHHYSFHPVFIDWITASVVKPKFADAKRECHGRELEGLSTYFSWSKDFTSHSGQQINARKSHLIFSPAIDRHVKVEIMNLLNIEVKTGSFNYLGVPVGGKRLKVADYNFIIERILVKLAGWKWKLLSQAGRLTILQSTLSSVPLYLMSHCAIPLSVMDKIQRYFKAFLWGHNSGKRGLHLLSWNKICKPKRLEGLGLHDLR